MFLGNSHFFFMPLISQMVSESQRVNHLHMTGQLD